jgi:toxin ParE1/3/4
MARTIWILPRTRRDIVDLATHIGGQSPAAAERFFDCSAKLIEQLARSPHIGHRFQSINPLLDGVRVSTIPGFANHLVFHALLHDEVHIVRVLHGARDIDRAFEET